MSCITGQNALEPLAQQTFWFCVFLLHIKAKKEKKIHLSVMSELLCEY